MIRVWLSTARRRARAGRGPAVDPAVFLGAQFDVRDAQIEGLRDALAEALRANALLQGELATYKAPELMRRVLLYRRVHANEPTVATARAEDFRRPAAPTEQYDRRP